MTNKTAITVALGCVMLAAAATSFAGDPAAGKQKSGVCAACHGPDGNKTQTPEFPRLAGQYYDYLVKALQHYKSGARKNAIMAPMVANLSQRDIEDLAAYYASQRGLVSKY